MDRETNINCNKRSITNGNHSTCSENHGTSNHHDDCGEKRKCLCSAKGIIEVVGKKWSICIISHLEKNRSHRYNELKKSLKDISPKSLSDTLKLLEHEGLIHREVYPETPPRVEYSLTEEGTELRDALMSLVEWVAKRETKEEMT